MGMARTCSQNGSQLASKNCTLMGARRQKKEGSTAGDMTQNCRKGAQGEVLKTLGGGSISSGEGITWGQRACSPVLHKENGQYIIKSKRLNIISEIELVSTDAQSKKPSHNGRIDQPTTVCDRFTLPAHSIANIDNIELVPLELDTSNREAIRKAREARKGYGSVAHEAKPNGLLTRSPWGRKV